MIPGFFRDELDRIVEFQSCILFVRSLRFFLGIFIFVCVPHVKDVALTLRRLTLLGDCNDIKEDVALGNRVFPLGRLDCRFANAFRRQMFWFVLRGRSGAAHCIFTEANRHFVTLTGEHFFGPALPMSTWVHKIMQDLHNALGSW